MPLTNTQINYYNSNVLRLPDDKRKEYHGIVDRLVADLNTHILSRTDIKVTKVVKAGSFAKFTILLKTAEDSVDVDVVFYISDRSVTEETLQGLLDAIFEMLVKVYPNKKIEDFELHRKAATVTFTRTGLSVDIVPVIQIPEKPTHGWQYDLTDGTRSLACAPCQIKFVQDRKVLDTHFRTLVRLAKKWRNRAEVKPLKSFHIELILAHLLEKQGSAGTIEQRFRNFLLYIAQSGLKDKIAFPENVGFIPTFTDPVVILDPVYNLNNVASRISEAERLEIVAAAQEAWETANFASIENDIELWKELFGPHFKVED